MLTRCVGLGVVEGYKLSEVMSQRHCLIFWHITMAKVHLEDVMFTGNSGPSINPFGLQKISIEIIKRDVLKQLGLHKECDAPFWISISLATFL
ncbi:MAG: hypothetical protein ACI8V2_004561 [Candidatus Latescibacterota bacterium]